MIERNTKAFPPPELGLPLATVSMTRTQACRRIQDRSIFWNRIYLKLVDLQEWVLINSLEEMAFLFL